MFFSYDLEKLLDNIKYSRFHQFNSKFKLYIGGHYIIVVVYEAIFW